MGEGKAPGAAHSRISVADQGPGVGIGESAEGISESLTLGRPPAQTNKQTNKLLSLCEITRNSFFWKLVGS